MRKALTMIELVFVIVVIGILSAIALPRLAATRDDAIVAKIASNIAIGANEIANYAVSQGNTTTDFGLMSNAIQTMIANGTATQNNNVLNIAIGEIPDCIQLVILKNSIEANLTIRYGAQTNLLCTHLRSIIDSEDYPVPLFGQRTKW